MLVESTKGSRNQAQEIYGNLHILRQAMHHSMDPTINIEFSTFLSSHLIQSYHFPKPKTLKLRHKCKKEDDAVRRLFPHSTLQFYNVLHIGRLRISTRSYSHGKTSDDSNVLFLSSGTERFGRICAIFRVDDGEPVLFIAYLLNATPMVCNIDDSPKYEFRGIQVSPKSLWSFVLVEIKGFIEKTVLFEHDNHSNYFFRFPNLVHSS